MKKGLMLALMVVVAVAMAMPVVANAPIVKPLPDVIIGDMDAGDYNAGAGVGILRYLNAFSLNDYVLWNNDDYTSDLLHAYLGYSTAAPAIRAVNPFGVIPALTSDTISAVFASGDPTLVADARITSSSAVDGYDFFAMSLLDTSVDGGTTITSNPYTTDVVAAGHLLTDTTGYAESNDMLLLAGVTSSSNQVIFANPKMFTVYSLSGATDELQVRISEVQTYTFEAGSVDGWDFNTPTGTDFTGATKVDPTAPNGPGFNFGAGVTGLTHAEWRSPSNLAGDQDQVGRVYRALFTLHGTAAAAAAPGYRLTYRQKAFAHFGKVSVITQYTPLVGGAATETQVGDEKNAPYASNDVVARMYWVAPTGLTGMGDTEYLATQFLAQGDMRVYRVTLDALAIGGDAGVMTLDEVHVQSFERPLPVAPVAGLVWGQPSLADTGRVSGDNFNLDNGVGGIWRQVGTPAGYTLGSYTEGAATVRFALNLGANADPKYTGAAASVFTNRAAKILQPVDGTLYRLVWELSTANQEQCPYYRLNVSSVWFVGENGNTSGRTWGDFYNQPTGGAHLPDVPKKTGQTVAPCAPALTSSGQPTILESYVYSGDVASTGDSFIYPSFDAVDTGNFGASAFWPVPRSEMTLHYVAWENLGSDF